MKKIFIAVAILCAGFAVKAQDKEDATAFAKDIKQSGVQVFDVRTAAEYKTGHLPNALQADFTQKSEFYERAKYLDKQKPVYVYCLGGGRSAGAAKWMRENGFTKVVELEGGINAWKQSGLPVDDAAVKAPQLTMDNYNQQVKVKGWVLTDVGAAWCPPCRQMEPVLKDLLSKRKDVKLVKVDGGNDTDVMKAINATTLPTFIVYKDGVEQSRFTGVTSKDNLDAMLK
ncbi:rhodanese-like domain-containing protein [Chitinophaga sp. Cy-1792]|uniref:rhodanese-like domain-containing protein n=1 Tax=Chitinophaga sp. Cy-1792 TaxID=2608339 RepID=UPI001421A422|nr:rhodanese-like domain-containing protein [Chitinophaga sp. Cy-1792]NIG53290.1 thioredoxin fold domain-containing protein [Chitinophaga sp. Cy-1792]